MLARKQPTTADTKKKQNSSITFVSNSNKYHHVAKAAVATSSAHHNDDDDDDYYDHSTPYHNHHNRSSLSSNPTNTNGTPQQAIPLLGLASFAAQNLSHNAEYNSKLKSFKQEQCTPAAFFLLEDSQGNNQEDQFPHLRVLHKLCNPKKAHEKIHQDLKNHAPPLQWNTPILNIEHQHKLRYFVAPNCRLQLPSLWVVLTKTRRIPQNNPMFWAVDHQQTTAPFDCLFFNSGVKCDEHKDTHHCILCGGTHPLRLLRLSQVKSNFTSSCPVFRALQQEFVEFAEIFGVNKNDPAELRDFEDSVFPHEYYFGGEYSQNDRAWSLYFEDSQKRAQHLRLAQKSTGDNPLYFNRDKFDAFRYELVAKHFASAVKTLEDDHIQGVSVVLLLQQNSIIDIYGRFQRERRMIIDWEQTCIQQQSQLLAEEAHYFLRLKNEEASYFSSLLDEHKRLCRPPLPPAQCCVCLCETNPKLIPVPDDDDDEEEEGNNNNKINIDDLVDVQIHDNNSDDDDDDDGKQPSYKAIGYENGTFCDNNSFFIPDVNDERSHPPHRHFICKTCLNDDITLRWSKIEQEPGKTPEHSCLVVSCANIITDDSIMSICSPKAVKAYHKVRNDAEIALATAKQAELFKKTIAADVANAKEAIDHASRQEELRRQYGFGPTSSASMCPKCFHFVKIENCPDMIAHHGEVRQGSLIDNACSHCKFFATTRYGRWLPWDGILRTAEQLRERKSEGFYLDTENICSDTALSSEQRVEIYTANLSRTFQCRYREAHQAISATLTMPGNGIDLNAAANWIINYQEQQRLQLQQSSSPLSAAPHRFF